MKLARISSFRYVLILAVLFAVPFSSPFFPRSISAGESAADETSLFRAGMEHYRAGDYEEAISAFNELLEVNPERRDAERQVERSRTAIERREREQRVAEERRLEEERRAAERRAEEERLAEERRREEEARRQAEEQRAREDAIFSAGMEHYRAGDYEDAISAFNELLEVNPDRRDARTYIARAEREIERREREKELAEQRRREEEARREAEAQREKEDEMFSAGMEHYRAGDYEDAISAFNELLELNPDRRDAERQIERSRTAIERREREQRIAEERRLEEERRAAERRAEEERLAEERRREEEARREAEAQREKEDAIFSAGMEYYRAGDYEDAISSFNELLEVNPDRRDAERQIARSRTAIERREREKELAEQRRREEERLAEERRREEEARRQAEEQRAREDAMFSAGMEHYRAGDYEEAISSFNELLEVNPERRDAERQVARSRTAIERREREQRVAEERRLEEERRAAERRAEEERLAEERRREEEARRQAEEQRAREDEIFSAGMEHYRAGDYEEAISAFNELLEVNPDRRDAERQVARSRTAIERREREKELAEQRRREEERLAEERRREEEARRQAEEQRAREDEMFSAGMEHYRAGNYEEAISSFNELLEVNPDRRDAERQVARSRTAIERREREQRIAEERRLEEERRAAERRAEEERLAEERRREEEARREAEAQREKEDAIFSAGMEHYRAGDYEEAISAFNELLEVNPDRRDAERQIARSRTAIERREREKELAEQRRREEEARREAEAQREKEDAMFSAGMEHYRAGDYEEAISSFNELLEVNPDRRDAERQIARSRTAIERREREKELAEQRRREEEARREAEAQREKEDEIFSAGMEHYRAGDYEEAISAFNELLEVNPDRRDAERQVARSRTAIERREREQRIAEERRLEEERRAAERRAEEERLAEERRREEEARRQAEEQRAREDAMFSAGMEHYRAGDYEEAISAFNELLEVNPEHRDALRYKSGTMLAMERAERRDRKKEAERASKERVEAYRSAHREALMTVEELAEARDAEVSELMEKGVESFIEGDYDAAIVWFSRVFEIVPDHGPAARYIEVVEREKERREKELIREAERAELKEELAEIREERAAERIRAREQRLIERYLKQGDDYFRAGRYEHAIGRWEKVLEIDSQHSAALSKIRGAENEIDRRERIAENERLAARKLAEGHAAYRRGDYASAVSSLEEVPDLIPRDHPDYQRAVSAAQASRIAGIRADRRDARSLRDLTQRSQIMGIAEAWTPAERLRRDPDPVDRPEDPSRERRPLAERAREEISVSFERAHIRSVLRYLSEVSNVNIVLDETVFQVEEGLLPGGISPRVSIDLEDVPLIDALDVILRAKNLRYRLEENIIWITTPERLERERLVTKTYTLLSPVAGTVQFMMPDWEVDDRDDDERVRVLIDDDEEDEDTLVGVETVIDTLRESVSWPAGSILTFDERTGSLIVRNTPSNLRVLEDIIRMLEEPPGQVAIQTRFMTVRVSDLRRVESEFTDMFFDLGDGDLEIPRTGVGSRIGGTSGLSLDYERLSPTQFSYFLDALETKESSNLLSAPTILTRNQQEATIRVVRERWLPSDSWEVFYYYDPDEPGIPVQRSFLIPTSLDDEPIEDGIILLVRPEIGADMRTVTLDVRPIISEFLGFETFGAGDDLTQYAQVAERTIRTNVMVGDGETIVMGGLITESKRDRLTKVPLLGDVPLLGRLFSSTRTETDKESLLIFITVDLITPTGAKYRER